VDLGIEVGSFSGLEGPVFFGELASKEGTKLGVGRGIPRKGSKGGCGGVRKLKTEKRAFQQTGGGKI
jgi:hypothetical protein